jgi:two-component system response regulator YesN
MLKLLVVDDDEIICEGMRRTIPWDDVGIELVGCANSGEAALTLIREKTPHIVITDIRMPKIDGIKLAEILYQEMPSIKVVILSGFSDFTYAQKAIRYGVVDYLTKPLEAEELLALMARLKSNIEQKIDSRYSKMNIKEEFVQEMRKYTTALLQKEGKAACALLEKLLNNEDVRNMDDQKELCAEIVEHTFVALRDNGLLSSLQFQEECRRTFGEMYKLTYRKDLINWLYTFTNSITERMIAEKIGEPNLAVRKAMAYISTHYFENLSVQHIANEIGLNANYFSHIFKKHTGKAFTDYLNNVRIQKAKDLLANYRIAEVAELVGFSDYKYFSSIFKKIEGISPSTYIKYSAKTN